MNRISKIIAAAAAAFTLAAPALAGNVLGIVSAYEMNAGSTSQFHRFTISGVASGCGSSLTNSTTYFYFDSTNTFAKEFMVAVQTSKLAGTTIQVWWGANCQVTDIVQY